MYNNLSKVNTIKKSMASKIVYSHSVLHDIVSLAAKEVKGIVSLYGRGVKIRTINQELVIDVYVNTLSTVKCANVAFFVQENIKGNVEAVTGYTVREINVNILSVTIQKTTQDQSQDDTHNEE